MVGFLTIQPLPPKLRKNVYKKKEDDDDDEGWEGEMVTSIHLTYIDITLSWFAIQC